MQYILVATILFKFTLQFYKAADKFEIAVTTNILWSEI